MDFWLLGGSSVLLLLVMAVAQIFREDSTLIQQKFLMIAPLFGLMNIVCNHPHFIISYKLGYSRGIGFVFKHWFTLLALPILLFSLYGLAYTFHDKGVSENVLARGVNTVFEYGGLKYRFGQNGSLGPELLGLSILVMYLTVNWHYAKQAYGCMMVYGHYDKYLLKPIEKKVIRYNLLALATYYFLFVSRRVDNTTNGSFFDPRFAALSIPSLGLPGYFVEIALGFLIILTLATITVCVRKALLEKIYPSPTFVIIWVSLYVWWIPLFTIPEFYFLAVPFFHSLQYLPFAYRMEAKTISKNSFFFFQITWRLFFLFFLGFLMFEWLPMTMDLALNTSIVKTTWFFVTAFSVFINIHHFFIDSVVWRFDQQEIKTRILS